MYESDEFTSDEEDDELEDIFTLAVESKNRARKKGFFAGLFSPIQSKPKQIVMDEKTNEGRTSNCFPTLDCLSLFRTMSWKSPHPQFFSLGCVFSVRAHPLKPLAIFDNSLYD